MTDLTNRLADLANRLRKRALEQYEFGDHELMNEAADEIERFIADAQRQYIGCPVCGLGGDGGPTGYSCPRSDCPA